MDAEIAKKLRAPFPAEAVGKLPRVFCGACRKAQFKVCDKHQSVKCGECGNKMTTAHMHLDYVGHAAITDRLLAVDPAWTWEPLALTSEGLPARDREGGLWIRLTVAGVTRLGYGDAEGKTGPAAVKEAIGDALRNAGMRFGVALDLWHKDGPLVQDDEPGAQPTASGHQEPTAEPTVAERRAELAATCTENGWDLGIVAGLYAAAANHPLGEATDASRVRRFRDYLFTLPQSDLQPLPATNGAAQ